jgi:type IV pilus assembly protein PilC
MKFRYRARTQQGELQVGFIEGPTKDAAAGILTGYGLYVLSVAEAERKPGFISGLLNRVRAKDLMIFTRQFATLLEANVPLGDSLRTLTNQTRNVVLRETVLDIEADIDSGLSLSQALDRRSDIFSVFYVNMIRSAEITGRVQNVMSYLAEYLEKQVILTSKVKNAMIYPVIMVALFLVVAAVMGMVVLPQIGVVFKDLGAELPVFTEMLIAFGSFLASWWWAVFIVLGVLIGFLVEYFKSEEGHIVFDEFALRLPVFSKLLKELYVARFAESLSVLVKGGIPIVQAIEVTGNTVSSAVYEEALKNVAADVRRGELLSQSLARREDLFPPLVGQMVAVGEATGRLESLLDKISSFYTREVEDLVSNLVELIQPLLLIVIGGLIGLLFISILSPIYNLISTF